jgi:hypothetical protein
MQGPKKREFWVRAREECEAEKGCAIIYCRKLSFKNIHITYIIFSLKKRQHNIQLFLISMTNKYMIEQRRFFKWSTFILSDLPLKPCVIPGTRRATFAHYWDMARLVPGITHGL